MSLQKGKMKMVEKSSADKKNDKKMGLKEGSKKDMAMDAKMMPRRSTSSGYMPSRKG